MKRTCGFAKVATTGFTLIELMVVVVIISLLAAIAYPGYQQYVKRGRRADAKGTLLEMAQFMERYYAENNSYASATLPVTISPRDGAAVYDIKFGSACDEGANGVTTSPEAHCFLAQAVPVAGGSMDGDECGAFGIDNTGNRTVSGSASASQCWNR